MENFYYFISFIVFVLGLIVGSFLNCVIYRIGISEGSPRREAVGFLRGRSFCPHCKHILSWRDLIPIFSFLVLRGRCRYCKDKISIQYPLVELFTAIIFVFILNQELRIMNYEFSNSIFLILNSLFLFTIASFLILIFVYDLKHFIIPDKVVYPAIAITFLYNFILSLLVSGVGVAGFFLLIFLISKGKWLGFGDVKLGFLLGLFLGFPKIAVALFISYLVGAIIGIGIIFLKKGTMKTEVPFGPFLIFGTFVALFFGDFLSGWYINLIS